MRSRLHRSHDREHPAWHPWSHRRDGSTFPASSTVVALKNTWKCSRISSHRARYHRGTAIARSAGAQRAAICHRRAHRRRDHEINNPLQTIIGCVELMIDESGDPGTRTAIRTGAEGGRSRRPDRAQPAVLRPPQRARPRRRRSESVLARATAQLREHHLDQTNITLTLSFIPGPDRRR